MSGKSNTPLDVQDQEGRSFFRIYSVPVNRKYIWTLGQRKACFMTMKHVTEFMKECFSFKHGSIVRHLTKTSQFVLLYHCVLTWLGCIYQ